MWMTADATHESVPSWVCHTISREDYNLDVRWVCLRHGVQHCVHARRCAFRVQMADAVRRRRAPRCPRLKMAQHRNAVLPCVRNLGACLIPPQHPTHPSSDGRLLKNPGKRTVNELFVNPRVREPQPAQGSYW